MAGCGADAAPYFRIFNPVMQGRKFDPAWRLCAPLVSGTGAPARRHIHAPFAAPPAILAAPGSNSAAPIHGRSSITTKPARRRSPAMNACAPRHAAAVMRANKFEAAVIRAIRRMVMRSKPNGTTRSRNAALTKPKFPAFLPADRQ